MKIFTLILLTLLACGCQTTNWLPEQEGIFQADPISIQTDYPVVIYKRKF